MFNGRVKRAIIRDGEMSDLISGSLTVFIVCLFFFLINSLIRPFQILKIRKYFPILLRNIFLIIVECVKTEVDVE